ncbi:MAG: M42 family metallopeptidase [Anaerolineales bacterium]|jgi:putative aminopeptidase FrvX
MPSAIEREYISKTLIELLNIPSPTGATESAIHFLSQQLESLGYQANQTTKGGLMVVVPGKEEPPRALTAHVDTLGAMVKEIKANGRLKLTPIGSFAWNTVEGEGCQVHIRSGDPIRGSLLLTKASVHVHSSEVDKTERNADTLEVRVDARVEDADSVRQLGLEVGDFVSFDPRAEAGPAGFIRSRHLDDKAGVACMLAALKRLREESIQPTHTTYFHFSNYEEVGHGAAGGFPSDLAEIVAVDMAAVGKGQNSDEFHVTICVKDSGGPYHAGLTQRLRQLAEAGDIPFKLDVYPYYGSDAEALLRAGADVQAALIGPGVDASHNYERTHIEALEATTELIMTYISS